LRVSTVDQNPETQGIELRQFAQQRGYEIVHKSTLPSFFGDCRRDCEDRLFSIQANSIPSFHTQHSLARQLLFDSSDGVNRRSLFWYAQSIEK
jgi:hypothetical protein